MLTYHQLLMEDFMVKDPSLESMSQRPMYRNPCKVLERHEVERIDPSYYHGWGPNDPSVD